MADDESDALNAMIFEETIEADFLPDLAARQETLRRARVALERAQAMLELVRKVDARSHVEPAAEDSAQLRLPEI